VTHGTSGEFRVTARDVLRAPSPRFLLAGNFLIHTAVAVQATTLVKHVYDTTGREIDIGWIGLAEFLPIVAFVLLAGSAADRFDRKRVALTALAGELASSLLLVAHTMGGSGSVWPFFAVAALFGTSRAFLSPAARAMYPMVAPEGGLAPLIAMTSAVWTSAMIVGPAASGLLYSIDPAFSYGTAAVLSLGGGLLISRVRYERQAVQSERPSLRSAMEGLTFIRRTPILFAAIALDLFAVLFGGAVALLPVIATERLNVGDIAYGWLRAAIGIGAAVVAVFLAIRPLRRRIGTALLVSVGVFGVGTIVLGATTNYWIAFAAVAVLSGADMVSVFVRGTLVPLVTPNDKRGRVSAVENVFIGATNELGAFESGVVSQAIGAQATVVGGGVATLGVVAAWWVWFPSLRRIDKFSDLDAAPQR
jgi:MFS family permease